MTLSANPCQSSSAVTNTTTAMAMRISAAGISESSATPTGVAAMAPTSIQATLRQCTSRQTRGTRCAAVPREVRNRAGTISEGGSNSARLGTEISAKPNPAKPRT